MRLAKELLHEIDNPNLSLSEQARLRCQLARQFEEAGNYEAARAAMGELWQQVGERPKLEGLDEFVTAEVLLRAGALTADIGSCKQIEGAQQIAKDLISESERLFRTLGKQEGLAEAQIEIAVCYWREGAFDEARILLQEALTKLRDCENDIKAVCMLRQILVESSAQRFHDALQIATEAAPLFEKNANDVLKGKFHYGFGMLLRRLGTADSNDDYIDRALIEYAAASIYFEQAGLARYEAFVESNLGFLYWVIKKFNDAHEHLDRAQALFTSLKDRVHLAQVDETRSRVLLAEGRFAQAETIVGAAVRTLEKGGEQSLLAEALTTHGIALARLRECERAKTTFKQAGNVAEQAGDLKSAGLAALAMIEELGAYLSNEDLSVTIARAHELLTSIQDMSTLRRLGDCACGVVSLLHSQPDLPQSVDWSNFSVDHYWLRFEAHFIKLALRDSGGSVTQAARLLGLPSHQALLLRLNNRHQDLQQYRKPIIPRRQGVVRGNASIGTRKKASSKARTIRILHVEDDSGVAGMIKEVFAQEGWKVETCVDGNAAIKRITSRTRYDLLLLDYDLPGVNGMELVRRARQTPHRRQTPIIILSATLDEETAKLAGADAFMRKPEDITAVGQAVAQLLDQAPN